jgi:hypothetical protein
VWASKLTLAFSFEGEKMNENVARIVIAVARGIAWVIEQIIKKK